MRVPADKGAATGGASSRGAAADSVNWGATSRARGVTSRGAMVLRAPFQVLEERSHCRDISSS